MDEKLIRKVYMECPLCDKMHEVEEREHTAEVEIKGEIVSYTERYYFCENVEIEESGFVTAGMMNENLLNARNEYRKKHGLMTSDEIIKLRESHGMSQSDLSKLIGLEETAISRYERKAIQDETCDNILRLIFDNQLK